MSWLHATHLKPPRCRKKLSSYRFRFVFKVLQVYIHRWATLTAFRRMGTICWKDIWAFKTEIHEKIYFFRGIIILTKALFRQAIDTWGTMSAGNAATLPTYYVQFNSMPLTFDVILSKSDHITFFRKYWTIFFQYSPPCYHLVLITVQHDAAHNASKFSNSIEYKAALSPLAAVCFSYLAYIDGWPGSNHETIQDYRFL